MLLEKMMSRSEKSSKWVPLALILVATAYRLFLTTHYYGWEESDYGNLQMTRGVLDSGFRDYDMRHLPLYYFISAVVLALVGNTVVATHLVSLAAGVADVVLVYFIARRAFDEWTGRIAALVLCFQPEYALYASSSLRDPLFTCLALLGCLLLLRGKPRLAAVSTGLSFLTRFDSLGTNMPAMLFHLVRRPPRLRNLHHPVWAVLGILMVFVAAWSIYCGQVHGTYIFFEQTVQMNVQTGGAQEILSRLEFAHHGIEIVSSLFFQTLPRHLGTICWSLALLGMLIHRRELLARTARGTVFAYVVTNTLFWLAVGFVAQHEPEHNLYWIWMYTLISFWSMFSAAGFVHILRYCKGHVWISAGLCLFCTLGVAGPYVQQTRFQLEQSAELYRPQLELAKWVEANVPPRTALIFDNIPACYVNRNPHDWRFLTWMDIPVTPGSEDSLAAYLVQEHIQYVLWFKEEWTQAPVIAPYLSEMRTHDLGPVSLTPLAHEEHYGFIFYQVGKTAGAVP